MTSTAGSNTSGNRSADGGGGETATWTVKAGLAQMLQGRRHHGRRHAR